MEIEDDSSSRGQLGFKYYQEGDYKNSSPLLRQAVESGSLIYALPYADICLRNLDNGKHTLKEAALWYIRASDSGDGDAASYLGAISESLLEDNHENERIQLLVHFWAHEFANVGFELYTQGRFIDAAKSLKKAAKENHCLAQQLYADICLRQLDEKFHSFHEAAMWYLLSALGGDNQALSYLKSIVPDILQNGDYEAQMLAIVGSWAMVNTLPTLKLTDPDHINGYLAFKFGRRIDKTSAQKLPYLFERVAGGIIYYLTGCVHSVLNDQLFPKPESKDFSLEVQSCALEALGKAEVHLMKLPLCPFMYGPVYKSYLQTIDRKLEEGYLKTPPNLPDLPPLYAVLLDALQEETSSLGARDLSRVSHRDYPWLLAGIKFWKEKYRSRFDATSFSEEELIKSLNSFSARISDSDIEKILKLIESEDIWPNDKDHPISIEFKESMKIFFTTNFSREERIVREIEKNFYSKIHTLKIDCSLKEEREALKTPILMFYCRDLTLTNVGSNSASLSALEEASRYFVSLNLKIVFSPSFKSESITGQKIVSLLKKLHKRGITITLF